MIDIDDLVSALEHHSFKKDVNYRQCSYCPYNRFGDECEQNLAENALMAIELYRNEQRSKSVAEPTA